mmetsp:Transcript_18622/g.64110  ORF Transcript_18622/g.64110 Transcript_18622/m.64110 type:complete len:86 (-) Transcript_18622:20-277(-)
MSIEYETVDADEFTHINFGKGRGILRLHCDVERNVLEVWSPVTGPLWYSHDREFDKWTCIKDGHDLDGILVRDFLRSGLIGLPNI